MGRDSEARSAAGRERTVRVSRPLEHVAEVEIDRPPYNFLTKELVTELGDALLDLDKEPAVRAIVVCSAGRHFCAGADLVGNAPAVDHEPMAFYRQVGRLFTSQKPIVAAIQGRAVGGGAGLALAADMRVAAASSTFAFNFTRIGFHPGFAVTETLPAIIGHQAATYLLMSGRDVRAEEAHRLGLADRLVADEDVRDSARNLAGELAGAAPLSTIAVRRTMRRGQFDRVMAALLVESTEQLRLRPTADFAEGVVAARDRREPRFIGE